MRNQKGGGFDGWSFFGGLIVGVSLILIILAILLRTGDIKL